MPSAPATRAASKAAIVFSNSWAESPRCAHTRGLPLVRRQRVARPSRPRWGKNRDSAASGGRRDIWPPCTRLLDERLVERAHESIDMLAIAPQRHAQRGHADGIQWHTRSDRARAGLVDDAWIAADAMPDHRDAALLAQIDLIAEDGVEALANLAPIRDVRDGEPAAELLAFEIEVRERDRRGFEDL